MYTDNAETLTAELHPQFFACREDNAVIAYTVLFHYFQTPEHKNKKLDFTGQFLF